MALDECNMFEFRVLNPAGKFYSNLISTMKSMVEITGSILIISE